MISDSKLINFLDDFLNIEDVKDESKNGVQVDAPTEVEKIAFAVDVRKDIVENAVVSEADLLLVHHGLIWGEGLGPLTGKDYIIIKKLIKNDIGLYAAHLPLDIHPEVGNNVELARILGAKIEEPFMKYNDTKIARMATFESSKKVMDLAKTLETELATKTNVIKGDKKVKKVGILTGKGGQALKSAKENGAELLITGERTYTTYNEAIDRDMALIFAGHYATETLGVKKLKGIIEDDFEIKTEFIPSSTSI